jgi:hypothetical protein
VNRLPNGITSVADLAEVTADGLSSAFDISKYEGALGFLLSARNKAGTNPTLGIKLQHSSDNDADPYTDVGGGAFTALTDTTALQLLVIDKNALKQYVKVAFDIGGTDTPKYEAAVALIGDFKYAPDIGG